MSDHLIKVLRAMGNAYTTSAADRIEALEAALRDVLGAHDLYETECIASAALAPEQDK